MDELVAASRNLIGRAERKIHDGREAGIELAEAVGLLDKAEGHFERGEYADAVEHAWAAEQKLAEALRAQTDAKAEGLRNAQEAARAELAAIRKTMLDLARADISILGSERALARAEAAFEAARYQEIGPALAETRDMAAGLTVGLEAAAKDLVGFAQTEIDEVRAGGLDPGRADSVLQNAREAINDGRFVEAIEYKKVIEDILEETRRAKEAEAAREGLTELRARVEATARLGADVRMASELLSKAQADIDAGTLDEVGAFSKRVAEEIDMARKAHLGSLVDSFAPLVEEGTSLGLRPE